MRAMTKLLEQAVERLRQLPKSDQDAMARLLMEGTEPQRQREQVAALLGLPPGSGDEAARPRTSLRDVKPVSVGKLLRPVFLPDDDLMEEMIGDKYDYLKTKREGDE